MRRGRRLAEVLLWLRGMTTSRGLWSLVLLGCACGASPLPAVDSGTGVPASDSGLPSTPTDAGQSDAGAVAIDVEREPLCGPRVGCAAQWSEQDGGYPVNVDHHVTFAHSSDAGTFLYVVGGVDNDFSTLLAVHKQVRRAPILESGALGAWEELSPLPIGVAFAALARQGNAVYVVGGVTQNAQGPAASAAVFKGSLDEAGRIAWESVGTIPEAALHATAHVAGQRLYVIGGTAQAPKSKVLVAEFDGAGRLGAFTEGPALPSARSHHATVSWKGDLFLLGGFDANNEPVVNVSRSVRDGLGKITGWALVGELQAPPWTHGAEVLGDTLVLVGGGEGGAGQERYVDRVRRAQLDEERNVGPFEDIALPLPVARAHVHQTPIVRGRIYSVGGRLEQGLRSTNRVFIGSLRSTAK